MITTEMGPCTVRLRRRWSTVDGLSRRDASAGVHRRTMSIPLPTPRRSLIAAGTPAGHIARDRKAGRTVAVFRGVHVDAVHAAGQLARFRAALATQGVAALIGMQSSAVLLGLRWIPQQWSLPSEPVHIVVPPDDDHRQRPGLRLHRRTTTASDVTLANGIPCLSVTRTLVELARMNLPELLVVQIIDGALFDKRTTKAELLACLERFAGERNVAVARSRVERAREKVRSPQETRLRLMLEDAGVHVEVAIEISDWDGELLAEGDLGIRRLLLWGEYDGFDTHTKRTTFRGDRVGDRWLGRRGWNVMRFVDEDLSRREATVREWLQAIAEAPARIAAMDPRRSPEVAEARRLLGFDPPLPS